MAHFKGVGCVFSSKTCNLSCGYIGYKTTLPQGEKMKEDKAKRVFEKHKRKRREETVFRSGWLQDVMRKAKEKQNNAAPDPRRAR